MRILVADDDFTSRMILSGVLRKSGYEVVEAVDGNQAWRVMQKPGAPSLAILDWMMPGIEGPEVVRQIRALKQPQPPYLIILTGKEGKADMVTGLDSGANDYLAKPFDPGELLARIGVGRRMVEMQEQLATQLQELRNSEFRYRSVVEHAGDIIYRTDAHGRFTYYNDAAVRILAYSRGEVIGRPFTDLVHPLDRAEAFRFYARQLKSGNPETYFEFRCITGNGQTRWLGQNVQLFLDEKDRVAGFQAIARDITERRISEAALASQAAHDALTGLANRTLLSARMNRCIEQNQRDSDYIFAIIFLDLDRFKVINDSLGHVAGDQLLVEISRRLAQTVRASDLIGRLTEHGIVARFGGDEFAVLVENVQSIENARQIADRILFDMKLPFFLEGRNVFTTFSIGVALSNDTYHSAEEILRDADIAMYEAKFSGKAQVAIFDPAMRARAVARLETETDLRSALTNHELVVHYQPEVDLRTGEIFGFEALVRWQHPRHGIVPPLDFIPIAEETGLIVPLGAWVLDEACRQMQRWQSAFPELPGLRMSVNLSGKQLVSVDLLRDLEHALQVSSLPPQSLDLEITESVLMVDTEAAIQTLGRLKAIGVGLQIDDFGTGYSSLSYLHRLPFDTLKIDRSFVHSMDVQEDGIEIVRTIMALARSLKMRVIAEGVENRSQLSRLRELGCRFGQGNHFYAAMDVSSVENLLAERSRSRNAPPELIPAGWSLGLT